MWAQMISTRLREGKEGALDALFDQLRAAEQPGSGLVRSMAFREQHDPGRLHMLVLFESEEQARAREGDPRRQEQLVEVRRTMAEAFEGAPEFMDLEVVADYAP